MATIAAFFDIDGTIARNSLMVSHFLQLIQMSIIDEKVWYEELRDFYELYEKRLDHYDNYLLELAKILKREIQNIEVDFNEHIAKFVVKKYGEQVYKYTRDRMEYHKENNHKIIFISGSPDFLVGEMANFYGATDFSGTNFFHKDNFYTGTVEPMWDSDSKKKEILNFVEKYEVDLESSYAYGDTIGDLSMFHLVGNPVAINPTKSLMEILQEDEELLEKILIVVERKNVIYRLKGKVDFE